jgi:hypothetical protein
MSINYNYFYLCLAYFSSFITILPFIIAYFRKTYLTKEQKLLWALIAISILTEIIGNISVFCFNSKNNILLFNLYTIIETILISTYYYFIIPNRYWKSLIFIISVLISTYSISQLLPTKVTSLNSISLTTESLMIVVFSILTFHNILKYPKYLNLLSAPIFWINSAFLLFFSGNLFLHLFSQYLQEHGLAAFYELWALWHSLLNILFYTLISIGFWKTKT